MCPENLVAKVKGIQDKSHKTSAEKKE